MQSLIPSPYTLDDLLPHRDNMRLIDAVLEVDRERARTRSVVRRSWPLVRHNMVTPLILLEVAAQTAGVCNGWDRIQTQGPESDSMGWLVGIKDAEFFTGALAVGSELIGWAENRYSFENLREVACEVRQDTTLLLRVILQLFQQRRTA